ncbi:MAG: DUF308 domain-containing protein [Leadbetterella sp.]|nr:DUF308 domain-containing protein [Leadbetterella sp.]
MATFLKTIRNTVKYWYVPAIIGVLFIVVGVSSFGTLEKTYLALASLFSYSFLFSGVLEIWFSVENRKELEGWGWYLASGILTLLIGILLIVHPALAAATLPLFVGFSLLFRAFQGLGFAFELRNYGILKWGNLAIVSILGIIFSFLLIANPIITGVSLVVLTSFAFIFVGINAIVLAFQLRKLKTLPGKLQNELKDKIENLKEEYYKNLKDNE